MKRLGLAGLAILAGAALLAAAAPNWLVTGTITPMGSYVVGNPAAKVKLVEYLSYTCSHCAAFSAEGAPTLKRDYVARGRASIEVRHAVRDQMDLAAALIARCDGPARFLAHSDAIFAAQGDWMTKGIMFESANAPRLSKLKISPALIETAAGSGLEALARAWGMAPARIKACLSNEAQQKLLSAQAKDAWEIRKIPGTPAFFLNGTLVPKAASWAALKPPLDAAFN